MQLSYIVSTQHLGIYIASCLSMTTNMLFFYSMQRYLLFWSLQGCKMKVGEQMKRNFFELFKENKSCPLSKRAYSRHPYALPRNKLRGTNCVPEEGEKERKEEKYFLLQYYHFDKINEFNDWLSTMIRVCFTQHVAACLWAKSKLYLKIYVLMH